MGEARLGAGGRRRRRCWQRDFEGRGLPRGGKKGAREGLPGNGRSWWAVGLLCQELANTEGC